MLTINVTLAQTTTVFSLVFITQLLSYASLVFYKDYDASVKTFMPAKLALPSLILIGIFIPSFMPVSLVVAAAAAAFATISDFKSRTVYVPVMTAVALLAIFSNPLSYVTIFSEVAVLIIWLFLVIPRPAPDALSLVAMVGLVISLAFVSKAFALSAIVVFFLAHFGVFLYYKVYKKTDMFPFPYYLVAGPTIIYAALGVAIFGQGFRLGSSPWWVMLAPLLVIPAALFMQKAMKELKKVPEDENINN